MKPDSSTPPPSKTARKAHSAELQKLGEQLLQLAPEQRHRLALPTRLLEALDALEHTHSFEGQRRQRQFVGKLMRRLDEEQIAAAQQALDEQRHGSAAATLRLHELERWREQLLADDAAITRWVARHPATDVQQLRSLVRQVRKDAQRGEADPAMKTAGTAPRKNRAWRQLYQFLASLYDADERPAP